MAIFKNKWFYILGVPGFLFTWYLVRQLFLPGVPEPSNAARQLAKEVTIVRDQWGVPHIFGKTHRATAFGLAYAHAEDDWPTIQQVIAAARGQLGLVLMSKTALINDYYTRMVQVQKKVDRDYDKLSPETRALLEGYAEGINYYASKHGHEVDARLLPLTGKDMAAGFVHKLPLLVGLPLVMAQINNQPKDVGDLEHKKKKYTVLKKKKTTFCISTCLEELHELNMQWPGSNAHALAAFRSDDNTTRLNINSHQPWSGPVAWYEAHLVSEEGLNVSGATFPGAPMILHGHNENLGWAHTVNFPDLVDVYKLTVRNDEEYLLDGKYVKLEKEKVTLPFDTGFFTANLPQIIYRSVHGPVLKSDDQYYALRYAGAERAIFAAEQWLQMNLARNFTEFRSAFDTRGLPMFNTVYADFNNIYYLYNGLLPIRPKNYDYKKVLPGDKSDALWQNYLPVSQLPQVKNPPAGFVQNCNHSPFFATLGTGNPRPSAYPASFGIGATHNNRSLRTEEILGDFIKQGKKISRAMFLKMKFDRQYHKDAKIFTEAINPLLQQYLPENENEKKAFEILKEWNGRADPESTGATLAILTWQPLSGIVPDLRDHDFTSYEESFKYAVKFLKEYYGRVDVPLAQVQVLKRGDVELGLGGGPQLLNAVLGNLYQDKLVGFQGDSYIMIAEFSSTGVSSTSRHQYGNVNRPNSKHYADQAPGFVDQTLKPHHRTLAELKNHEHEEYRPGER